MDPLPLPSSDDGPGRTGNAGDLFRDGRAGEPGRSQPVIPRPVEVGSYELEGAAPTAHQPAPYPIYRPATAAAATGADTFAPPAPAWPPPSPSPSSARGIADASVQTEEPVGQVWSRLREWGVSMFALVLTGVILLTGLYILLALEYYSVALLTLFAGWLVLALLSYPILITLERPVRVTPEQAVKDFYAALSHHLPHYTRMWLLLGSAGKVCSSYATFEGFKRYWRKRAAGLRVGRAYPWTPLKFEVHDFRSERSAGKTLLNASFVIKVFVRGRYEQGPVETVRVETRLVKGPDRMWYVDRGTLPEDRRRPGETRVEAARPRSRRPVRRSAGSVGQRSNAEAVPAAPKGAGSSTRRSG